MIIYIGFSTKTHKLHARIFCRKYKHCAPIIVNGNKATLYQFVRINKIVAIHIRKKDLNILKHYGWTFIKYNGEIFEKNVLDIHAITCVHFVKKVCGIKSLRIQTPDTLLKHLTKK